MKEVIYVILALVVVQAVANSVAFMIRHDNEAVAVAAKYVVEAYVGDIEGATEQDANLCGSAWKNGGEYYRHFNNVKLTCKRHSVEIKKDHTNE